MWTAGRAPSRSQPRTPFGSVHSASLSTSSIQSSPQHPRRSGYESDQSSDTAAEDDIQIQSLQFPAVPSPNMSAMWNTRQNSGSAVSRLSQKFVGTVNVADINPPALRTQSQYQGDSMDNSPDGDDTHSRASTLGGDDHEFQFPEKTPTMLRPLKPAKAADDEKPSLDHSSHVPGPLESQLAALMSKLIFIEQKNPTVSVTPDEYKAMSARVHALEAEKAAWTKRHEAIWALRDEDVDNNIKIRGLLAKTRRDLESMTALRDADLENLQIVRGKLCDSTRQLERLQTQNINGRTSPARGGRPGSIVMERRGTMDLFAAAKAAALEQRALELEQRNSDLLGQIETLKGGAKPDDLNRMTAHKAWKDTVSDLEARLKAKDSELARLRGTSVSSAVPLGGTAPEWHRIDAIHEEHASYREKVGGRMQALRSEKEALQREVHRKDDETHALEVKIQSLQRRLTAG